MASHLASARKLVVVVGLDPFNGSVGGILKQQRRWRDRLLKLDLGWLVGRAHQFDSAGTRDDLGPASAFPNLVQTADATTMWPCDTLKTFRCATFHEGGVVEVPILRA